MLMQYATQVNLYIAITDRAALDGPGLSIIEVKVLVAA
jgi:hypothetical protein